MFSFLRQERMFVNFEHSFFLIQFISNIGHNRDKRQNNTGFVLLELLTSITNLSLVDSDRNE